MGAYRFSCFKDREEHPYAKDAKITRRTRKRQRKKPKKMERKRETKSNGLLPSFGFTFCFSWMSFCVLCETFASFAYGCPLFAAPVQPRGLIYCCLPNRPQPSPSCLGPHATC